jgi:hypothetical protein
MKEVHLWVIVFKCGVVKNIRDKLEKGGLSDEA